MTCYQTGHAVFQKDDASPVTEADREADRIIVAKLRQITPGIPIVSEEGEKPDIAEAEYFWLVDPLDGTKSFIRGKGHFTVNIGLIHNRREAVLGVIYDPVSKEMYYGSAQGAFCERNGTEVPIHVRRKEAPLTALVSHSHINAATEGYLVAHHIEKRIPSASSIKFCMLAEGKADIYPRFGPTMEWDVAAGHAILAAAGGKLTLPEGQPFLYGKPDFLNGDFIAQGGE